MRAVRIAVLLNMSTLIAASGAAAQEGPTMLPSKQVEAHLAAYADCVVAQRSYLPKVNQFLRSVPNSEGFFPAAMKAADMHCLDIAARIMGGKLEMRLQPATYRDALYPALYRREFGRAGPVAGLAALPPLSLSGEFDGSLTDLPADYRPTRALGDCVARAAPQAAHSLLIAKPYTGREDEAVEALKPALASCLSEGQTVRLNRPVIRASVGEAMYKLSRAVSSPKT